MKNYLLIESKVINEYDNEKEALADLENHKLFYPESNFKIEIQDI
jgi:hypothetical protein